MTSGVSIYNNMYMEAAILRRLYCGLRANCALRVFYMLRVCSMTCLYRAPFVRLDCCTCVLSACVLLVSCGCALYYVLRLWLPTICCGCAVSRVLCAVCVVLSATCCVLCVACSLSLGTCCVLCALCCVLRAVCCGLRAVCCVFAARCVPCVC